MQLPWSGAASLLAPGPGPPPAPGLRLPGSRALGAACPARSAARTARPIAGGSEGRAEPGGCTRAGLGARPPRDGPLRGAASWAGPCAPGPARRSAQRGAQLLEQQRPPAPLGDPGSQGEKYVVLKRHYQEAAPGRRPAWPCGRAHGQGQRRGLHCPTYWSLTSVLRALQPGAASRGPLLQPPTHSPSPQERQRRMQRASPSRSRSRTPPKMAGAAWAPALWRWTLWRRSGCRGRPAGTCSP
ncbi:hypothetical protein DR999_PMT15449 [Platysternon megacephalum]|uniref:Uncharacterized protein n=1 Tax=Platysternon megacephalum TaxID=55544 RepID=A0A4D9E212_9SAUR|nr:hypothetical protein DR999_PMT15449 [Platysternon megacephalum]